MAKKGRKKRARRLGTPDLKMSRLNVLTTLTLRKIDKALAKPDGLKADTIRNLTNSQATLQASLAAFNKRNFCCPQGMRIPLIRAKKDGSRR